VLIKEVRPISKKKHWMLVKIIKKNKEEKIELKEDVLEANSRSDKNDTGTN